MKQCWPSSLTHICGIMVRWAYMSCWVFFTEVTGKRHPSHVLNSLQTDYHFSMLYRQASWSSGRVVDSGWGCRSSPEFNTLPAGLLVVPQSKALHTALLLPFPGVNGYLWGQVCKPWCQVACDWYMDCKGPMTREDTCQSLPSRALGWTWTQNSGFTFLQAHSCGTNYERFRVLNLVPNILSISIMKNIKSYHRYVVTWNISTWQDSCWYLVKWTLTNKRQWNLCEDSLALLFCRSNMIMNMCYQYGNNR